MKKKFRNRIISAFLAAAMGMSSFSGLAVTAYAAEDTGTNSNGLTLSNIDLDEDESNNDVASGNQGSDTTSSNAEDETGETPNQSSIVDDGIATADEAPDVDADSNVSSEDNTANSVTSDSSEEEVADEDTQLSENVKAFLHAVEQCDFDAAVAKTNAYYLAQKKQQSDWYNEELIQQSQKAEEEMYAAVSLVDEADELYYNLTEDECQIQSVIDARTKLDDCYIRMDNAMKNPVEDGNKKGEGYSGEVTPEDIWLYLGEGRIPDKPTGYYIGENGLPVMTGNTKISISEYTDGGESEDLRMERAPLDEDNLSVVSQKVENEDYSITKILAQVEYPENNSFAKITLGDNAKLIDAIYVGDESLRYMDEDAQKSVLLKDFHNSSAWYITYYVVSQDDFDATITYTNSTGVSTSKTMHVDVDDENVMTQDELNSLVGYDLKTSNIAEANSDSRLATTGSLLGRAILFWTGAPPVGGTVSCEQNGGIWDSFLVAGGAVIALFCLNQSLNVKGLYTYLKDFAANLAPYFGADYHTISGAFWSGAITLYDLASVRDVNDYDSSSLADFAKAYENNQLDDVSMAALTTNDVNDEVFKLAYTRCTDAELYIIEHFPDSDFAQMMMQALKEYNEKGYWSESPFFNGSQDTLNLASADDNISLANNSEKSLYLVHGYTSGAAGQQNMLVLSKTLADGTEVPDTPDQPGGQTKFYAEWSPAPQSASDEFTYSYVVRADKNGSVTGEKVDDSIIDIEPLKKNGEIDGGNWTISPATKQTITTSGHTNDNNYQNNGGTGRVAWTLKYSVTKTVNGTGGRVGPYASQAEADAAAAEAKAKAEADLLNQAKNQVTNAISSARDQLKALQFSYKETKVPYGFNADTSALGSNQEISVPADSDNFYPMKNEGWKLQVKLNKVDSETGNQIANDANFEVYEWDTVTQMYIPSGDYNKYSVAREADGTYYVKNDSPYVNGDNTKAHTMYYTQRNEGRFIIVETQAPSGYYGDWTDPLNPGTAGTPLGKRAYYIEITKANDGSVINLDNKDYSADIATSYTGGTKLHTSGGVDATVTIYKESDQPAATINYKDPARSYDTDNSKKGANEDEYHTANDKDNVFQNDRVIGEISLSKVDLDAIRYIDGRTADGSQIKSGESHGDAIVDGAIYDLYAAEDIQHPDGKHGIVDYSKITYADGTPIWHTTIRENSGHWNTEYLPVLKKDNLVASAEIKDGWLSFSNLYLGKYYIVERGTGVIIPVDAGAYHVSGTYPNIDTKTKETTTGTTALAKNGNGEYTDYVYKNQFSYVEAGKGNQDNFHSNKTYEGVYVSYSKGYYCDEHNYYVSPAYSSEGSYVEKITFEDNRQSNDEKLDTTTYSKYYRIQKNNDLTESQEQVQKTDIQIQKKSSTNGNSSMDWLEGAGFTLYLISDLSKADKIAQARDGSYIYSSLWDTYINENYDNEHPKWDFSGETQAIAKMYESDPNEVALYNNSLTAAEDYVNGKGEGWVATGNKNEYQLSELFSNDTGNLRIFGLPYGQYVLIETTVPEDRMQADPVIFDVTADEGLIPVSRFSDIKGSSTTPAGGFMNYSYVIDNEIMDAYLRIYKKDVETGKDVMREGTAFQLYWMDDNGNYILDKKGNPRLVTMTATLDGSAIKKVDTFYTNAEGNIALPEKLEVGNYRIVEVQGPEGFYNEWADTAQYGENGILLDKDKNGVYSTGNYYVDFKVTTNRIWNATGDLNEDDADNLVIEEKYWNNETIGRINIKKTGEVLTGFDKTTGKFTYEERPLAGAEFQIIAAEDIVTQDNQKDANGNRTLWYAKGDVVATVVSGDGTADTVVFAPTRTPATYDFLSVIHDGAVGEVGITLPLGKYTVLETKAPYGYVLNDTRYDVELTWSDQIQDVNFASEITQTVTLESDNLFEVPGYTYIPVWIDDEAPVDNGDGTGTTVVRVDENGNEVPEDEISTDVDVGDDELDPDIAVDDGIDVGYGHIEQIAIGDVNMDGKIDMADYELLIGYLDVRSGKKVVEGENPYVLTASQLEIANVTNNLNRFDREDQSDSADDNFVATDPIDPTWEYDGFDAREVTYADAETLLRFINGEIDRLPYTLDHPNTEQRSTTNDYDVTRVKDADDEFVDSQKLLFVNDREKARVGVFKFDIKTNKFVSGAIFELYAKDDIYDADGNKIFSAGDLIATSPETRDDGYTYFDVDVPIRGENYSNKDYTAKDATTNSGNYTVLEKQAPDGYYLDKTPKDVSFTYDGEALQVLDSECLNVPSTIYISKRDLTNDDELPGATLQIKDKDGNVLREWVSTDKKKEINALSFKDGNEYTLTEIREASGYALASDITFKLEQQKDENGELIDEVNVYYKDGKKWKLLDSQTVIMKDDITKVEISKKDITNNNELPGAKLEIKDKDGNTIHEWTSSDTPHYIEKLPAGDYTLVETTAPNGYLKAEDVPFTVLPTGDIQHVQMFDKPDDYGILIHKVDKETKQAIKGIAFQIINADTGKIQTFEKDGKTYDCFNWTNDAGNIWFSLPKGNYYYQEIKVTPDYLCDSTLYPFTISDETRQVEIIFENTRSPFYGIITFFNNYFGKKGTIPGTGTTPNGVGTETTATAETAVATSPVNSTNSIALVVGAVILVVVAVGGGSYVVITKRKKKTALAEIDDEKDEESDKSDE